MLPLLVGQAVAYFAVQTSLRQDAFAQLQSVGTGRRASVGLFLEGRVDQIKQITTNQMVQETTRNLTTPEAKALLSDNLQFIKKATPAFLNLTVLDGSGRVVGATDKSLLGQSFADTEEFREGRQGVFVDPTLHRDEKTGEVVFDISVPVTDATTVKHVGVVIGEMTTDQLNEITIEREGLGETGEVYLVDKDGLMLTDSRFADGLALQQSVDSFGVREALAGRDGVSACREFALPLSPDSPESRMIVLKGMDCPVALWVDSVKGLVRLREDDFQPAPPGVARIDSEYFAQVATVDAQMLIELDVDKLQTDTAAKRGTSRF